NLSGLRRSLATPGEALPRLPAVALVGIAHLAHAADEDALGIGAEQQRVDAALIAVDLDDAPTRKRRRRPGGQLLAAGKLPDADLAHEVPRGHVLPIGAERDRLHRWDVRECVNQFARRSIEDV